eukprot:SAG31_NODE_1357_length_8647_cov_8.257838_4_plen_58_part_00
MRAGGRAWLPGCTTCSLPVSMKLLAKTSPFDAGPRAAVPNTIVPQNGTPFKMRLQFG